MDTPLWGVRVDGLMGRRFLRGLSLTRLWREGCCRAPLNYRRRPLMKKPLQLPCGRRKTGQPPWRARKCISPFGGWRHHLARWEACHWIRGLQSSPMNPVPLPPLQAGALWVLSNGAMSLQESIERFILSPGWGGKGTRVTPANIF